MRSEFLVERVRFAHQHWIDRRDIDGVGLGWPQNRSMYIEVSSIQVQNFGQSRQVFRRAECFESDQVQPIVIGMS